MPWVPPETVIKSVKMQMSLLNNHLRPETRVTNCFSYFIALLLFCFFVDLGLLFTCTVVPNLSDLSLVSEWMSWRSQSKSQLTFKYTFPVIELTMGFANCAYFHVIGHLYVQNLVLLFTKVPHIPVRSLKSLHSQHKWTTLLVNSLFLVLEKAKGGVTFLPFCF